jgi:sulfhydrogenase subunit beta (sulfur reductase)
MSGNVFIPYDELIPVLERLSREMDVWVPQAADDEKRGIHFSKYRTGSVPVLGRQSTTAPKKVLFPQVEALFGFHYRKDAAQPSQVTVDLNASGGGKPALVFGARPCDARGFLTFDRVFLKEQCKDPYYAARRENVFFATQVCETADGACFCSSVGGGPGDGQGSDLWITPIDAGYVLESINDRGETLLGDLGKAASENQIASARRIREAAAARQVGQGTLADKARAFEARFSDSQYWRDEVSTCISCGICTYVCPTCYCFTISDEIKDLQGERFRSWDSCMFYHYTLEASGHNPRPSKFERYRNRIGHKFSYFPDQYDGMTACCGCGRCIRSCPVSMDIRRIVRQL